MNGARRADHGHRRGRLARPQVVRISAALVSLAGGHADDERCMTRIRPTPRTRGTRRDASRRRTNPPFLGLALGGVAVVTLGLWFGLRLHLLWAYLIAVNAATLLAYAYDKAAAARPGASRIPERTLHVLATLGGTPAAWAAQRVLRHKTIKGSFRLRFWLIAAAQAALIAAWSWWRFRTA